MNAENIQLKEDLNNLKQRHEAEKKELLKNLEKLRQDAAHADKRVESLQQAMQTEKRVARLPTVSRDGMLHPQKCEMFLMIVLVTMGTLICTVSTLCICTATCKGPSVAFRYQYTVWSH